MQSKQGREMDDAEILGSASNVPRTNVSKAPVMVFLIKKTKNCLLFKYLKFIIFINCELISAPEILLKQHSQFLKI